MLRDIQKNSNEHVFLFFDQCSFCRLTVRVKASQLFLLFLFPFHNTMPRVPSPPPSCSLRQPITEDRLERMTKKEKLKLALEELTEEKDNIRKFPRSIEFRRALFTITRQFQ
jgi:hypothetical protein